MGQAFSFIVQAGNAVNQLTGGALLGMILAWIGSMLFIALVGYVLSKLINR